MSVQPCPISSIVRLAPADPRRRIGIVLVVGRVVVPRDHVENRAGREEVRHLVFVGDLPRLFVVRRVGQDLATAVGMNRLELHARSAEVHVRLEADHQRRLRQRPEALVPHDRVRRNAEQRDGVQRVFGDAARRSASPARRSTACTPARSSRSSTRSRLSTQSLTDAGPNAM